MDRTTAYRLSAAVHARLTPATYRRAKHVLARGPVHRSWDEAENELLDLGLIEVYPRDEDTRNPGWRENHDDRVDVIATELGSWWDSFTDPKRHRYSDEPMLEPPDQKPPPTVL